MQNFFKGCTFSIKKLEQTNQINLKSEFFSQKLTPDTLTRFFTTIPIFLKSPFFCSKFKTREKSLLKKFFPWKFLRHTWNGMVTTLPQKNHRKCYIFAIKIRKKIYFKREHTDTKIFSENVPLDTLNRVFKTKTFIFFSKMQTYPIIIRKQF